MDKVFKAELAAGAIHRQLIIAQEHGAEHHMHIYCMERIHEWMGELADHLGYDIVKREVAK